jgi:ion channel-forming bestrophin family protein
MIWEKLHWFQIALRVRGSVFPVILPRILLFSGFGVIVSIIHSYAFSLPEQVGDITTNVAFNLVLGLLLVFRTNTAYERYWEGRKTWGGIVVNSLNLARNIQVAILEKEPIDRDKKAACLRLLSAFAIATKLHLRQSPERKELKPFLTESQDLQLKDVRNPPLKIAVWIGEYLKQQQINDCLSMEELVFMNSLLNNMVESLIGSERILKTPMPLIYAIYLKRLLLIYFIVLPLHLVSTLEWWTVPSVALISFTLLGIEEIGNQLEDPFGFDLYDLPLDDICQTLTKNLEDLMNENKDNLICQTESYLPS